MSTPMKNVVLPIPVTLWGGLHGVISALDEPLKYLGFMQKVIVPEEAEAVRDALLDRGVSAYCGQLPRLQRSLSKSTKATLEFLPALSKLRIMPEVLSADLFQAVGVHHPHAPLLAMLLDRPLVWQLHSDSVRGMFGLIAKAAIAGRQDGVLANGRAIGETYCGKKFGSGNHGVFYPAINARAFEPNQHSRAEVRRLFGYGDNEIVICTVGNRGSQKNHQLLIEVANSLKHHSLPMRFLIVGGEVDNYAQIYKEEVVNPAIALNAEIPNYIRFEFAPDGLTRIIQAADIFIMTSHAEGIPLVVAEAMSAAKPVVSVNVGAIAEIVEDGVTGYITPPAALQNLVERVAQLAEDPELRLAMGHNGMLKARSTFSPEAAARTHADVYSQAATHAR